MKITFALIVSAAVCLSCSEENTPENGDATNNTENNTSTNAPKSDDETEIEITFSSGVMKGTHLFKPDETNPMSQINIGFSDNVSNFSSSGLISSDGKYKLVLTRPIQGEASQGRHKAKKYTNECGMFIITPMDESSSFRKIRGYYEGCTETNVSASSTWEEGSIYNRRGVVANFSDNARLEIQQKEGPEEIEKSDVSVTIKARESRLKQ